MKSVGKQLQEGRLARNWTPELAARETKIKVDRLRDLEADDYTHFSSPTYARGFVRTYARALGLDEYKILRQLDTKLPEDETSSFGADAGIPYVPEPSAKSRISHEGNTGLYVVLSLGMGVILVISFILFEAYRAGVLPGYFAENSSTEESNASTTNITATTTEPVPARAKPVDANAAVPPITDNAETNTAPRALPVNAPVTATTATATNTNTAEMDTNAPVQAMRALPVDLNAQNTNASAPNRVPAVTTSSDMPFQSVRALPVDSSALTNAAPLEPVGASSPTQTSSPSADDGANPPMQAVRALPVNPSELTGTNPSAANGPPANVPNPAQASTATSPVPSTSARQANVSSAPAPASSVIQSATTDDPPPMTPTNDPSPATTTTAASAGKPLVLTASRDSFVRVMSEDSANPDKVLYASVIHTGQSVSFDGHKFSINIGVPAAVNITLDGVNYGPHSDQEAPETFTVESRQP
ncbi:MAG TPA: helix-turn-helix domain-containing protein [Candidatus Methylacidiphilales bacterium]|nr:helix-turn-helix domain-containing protein [Candidatus Methylacidiphilales bacterium]